MKDWVKPFLIQRMKEALDEDEELYPDREKIMDRRKKELEDEDAVYYELTYYFNVDFGGGLGWPIDHMITAFGSVLADLSKDTFEKLSAIKNLYFVFAPYPGAEVKMFRLERDTKAKSWLRIVTFPFDNAFMLYDALKGEIAHELAHIYQELDSPTVWNEIEDEADEIAVSWGFEKEIKEFRDYEKKNWEPKPNY
jgi:hypothetical protein